MEASYLPVPWVYREVIEEQIANAADGKIFYFNDGQIDEASGSVMLLEEDNTGVFIEMDSGRRIRIDRIITLFGKPGAAYDEYDAFGNSCMDCLGGYTKEEIDDFNKGL